MKQQLPGALGEILVDIRTPARLESRPTVVIMHGFKGFKDWGMFPPLADRLARAGLTAISFNVSGSGVDDSGAFTVPERFSRNTYSAELEDLHRVVDAVQAGAPLALPPAPALGLVGHSRGGGMAVLEAARNGGVSALVTWAAIATVDRWSAEAKASWRRRGHVNIQNARTGQVIPLETAILDDIAANGAGALDIMAAAARVRAPWLILHGEDDESVSIEDGRGLAAASGADPTRLVIIPGAGHTFGATHPLTGFPQPLEQAMNETVSWMGRLL